MTYTDENTVAAGSYDATYPDKPDEEIQCPQCQTWWEKRQVESIIGCSLHPLYDWQTPDGEYAYLTRDNSVKPVSGDFCYACALETATEEMLIEFAKTHADEFRDWRTFGE